MTALIGALATLIGAIATRIVLAPEPEQPPRVTAVSATEKALPEIPKDIDSSPADRFVRNAADQQIAALKEQVSALRATQCVVMRELRDTRTALTKLEGGKRAIEARDQFVAYTGEWARCPVLTGDGKRQELPSLREAADSALRR